ncbi:MAG: DUF6282 family protein [Clostridiales bacterium]|nr:DUF6282 family protein [Clostridiales bacterium]
MLQTEGIVDLHIHSAPDIRERRLNDLELMEAAVRMKVRSIVIKSHNVPTMDRATLVNIVCKDRHPDSDFQMFGGIALNQSVGGLNPFAVEKALKLGAKIVWLPTNTAANHYKKSQKSGGVEVVQDGKVVKELLPILNLIKEYNAVFETGHISAEECFYVVEVARNAGVQKIVITHPEFHIVGMTLEQQKRIVKDYDVLLEREYAQPIGGGVYKKNLPDNVIAMREIGCEHFIVSTDSGQMQNPPWYESIVEYINYLSDAGFTQEEIDMMTKVNPSKMLDIL